MPTRGTTWWILGAAVGVAGAVACFGNTVVQFLPDDGGVSEEAGGSASATLGPSGGTVRLGGASITLPPGALARSTVIAITSSTASPGTRWSSYSLLYTFSPSGLTFTKPATVVLPEHAAPPEAKVYWTLPRGTGYGALATTITGESASAEVTHFSEGFVGTSSESDGGGDAGPEGSVLPDAPPGPDPDAGEPDGPVLVASSPGTVHAFALDMGDIYWSWTNRGPETGAIMKKPLGGGAATTLATVEQAIDVAVDGNNVYFSDMTANIVGSVPKAGGTVTTLATAAALDGMLALSNKMLFFGYGAPPNLGWVSILGGSVNSLPGVSSAPGNGWVAASPSLLAWLDAIDGGGFDLFTLPIVGTGSFGEAGVSPGYLGTRPGNAGAGLFIDTAGIYVANYSAGEIDYAPFVGSIVPVLTGLTGTKSPGVIAADATNLYWGDASTVWEAPKGGGSPVSLASTTTATWIAVDATYVYWSDIGTTMGTIMKVRK